MVKLLHLAYMADKYTSSQDAVSLCLLRSWNWLCRGSWLVRGPVQLGANFLGVVAVHLLQGDSHQYMHRGGF